MDAISFGVYRSRGRQLNDAMELCAGDIEAYASAVALLAVHSAISCNDALLIFLTGKRSKKEDHQSAVTLIEKACRTSKLDRSGIDHLKKLLNAKTDISYGDRTVHAERALALSIAAERFQAWVEKSIAEIGKKVGG